MPINISVPHLKPHNTKRSRFTRMCIGEAIVLLLQTESLEHLKVSAVAKKAGVSRMTFYHYYTCVTDALHDYFNEIIEEYIEADNNNASRGNFLEYEHVLFSLQFFDQYSDFFNAMAANGLHTLLLNGINRFMFEQVANLKSPGLSDKLLSTYEMTYYAGGLLNVFLAWEQNGKKESPEDVASIICKCKPGKSLYS